jgi:hypothetical protein
MLDAMELWLSLTSSLAENEDQAASDLWWVWWVSSGVCTLGQAPLAVGAAASQRQAELMQRGPIIAGPAEGMQLCWPLPSRSSWEGGLALKAGWRPEIAAQPGPKDVCSGSALTQEGNTPFMEVPRALSSVCVCVCVSTYVPSGMSHS